MGNDVMPEETFSRGGGIGVQYRTNFFPEIKRSRHNRGVTKRHLRGLTEKKEQDDRKMR